jgi:hypothetical protein
MVCKSVATIIDDNVHANDSNFDKSNTTPLQYKFVMHSQPTTTTTTTTTTKTKETKQIDIRQVYIKNEPLSS